MTYSDENIALQLQLGEDSRWEFKQIDFSGTRPRSPSRNDLADEIAAFANAEGGVLLCSVTDKGEVQNLSREQLVALDAFLVEVSTDSIKPAVDVAINQGEAQPVHFGFGERLRLTDADANELDVRIIHIEGRSALVEYRHV